jgi:peptidyl-prolyl cis-trans isomerase D
MLHFLRRHKSSKLVWIGLAAIIGVFVLWGVGSVVNGANQINTIATVDGEPIEVLQVQRSERNLVQAYRDAYKDRFTPELRKQLNLRQRALDQLIDRRVLMNHAASLGLTISDQQLRDFIVNNPSFQSGGRFDKDAYVRALRYGGLTPATFEEDIRDDLAIQRLQAVVEDSIEVSDQEARDEIISRDQKLSIQYVKVKASSFTASIPVTDAELQKYYDEHKQAYTDPEKVKIEVLAYSPDGFKAGAAPSDAAVSDYYNEHKADRFTQQEQVRARHILIKVPQDASDEAKGAAADKIAGLKKKIAAGADFAAVAKENSQDEGSAKDGGDLGFFTRGRMVKEFEDAAFSLQPGEMSEIVETPFGFHLIKVEEVKPKKEKTLDEVHDEIVKTLTNEAAQAAAKAALDEDAATITGGGGLAAAAEKRGLKLEQPAPLARNEAIPGVGRSYPLMTALFDLQPGSFTEPVNVNGTWVIARLVEKVPPALKDFAAVKEQVETQYRLEKGTERAKEAADKLLAAAQAAGSLEKAAKDDKREVSKAEGIPPASPYIPGIGNSQELKDALAGQEPGGLVPHAFTVTGDSYVVALLSRDAPDEEKIKSQLAATKKQLIEQRQTSVFQRYLDGLKLRAKIAIDTQKLAQIPAA